MLLLRRGDNLPMVAYCQGKLNQNINTQLPKLVIDGQFGHKTYLRVQEFQRFNQLNPIGSINRSTWELLNSANSAIVDSVDITADNLNRELGTMNRSLLEFETQYLQDSGSEVVTHIALGNGSNNFITTIKNASLGRLILLRFHGHGSPGNQSVYQPNIGTQPFIEGGSLEHNTDLSYLRSLAGEFLHGGSVELHGCSVGNGVHGTELLTQLARILNVPVSAGIRTQNSGGTSNFRYEGEVKTIFPYGVNAVSWYSRIFH